MPKRHAVIVGGGISGLATAVELQRAAYREEIPLKITLVESQDRLGGVLRTDQQSPFVVEAAADAFYAGGSSGKEAVEFFMGLGLSGQLMETSASFRHFFILQNKKIKQVPNIFTSFDLAGLCRSPLLRGAAKIRLLGEVFIAPRKQAGDEGLGSFVRRRLGDDFYRSIMAPVTRGIYMADPETLSLETLFPRLRHWEQSCGSLGRAMWAERTNRDKEKTKSFLSFREGAEVLIQAMRHELKDDCEIRTGSVARSLKIKEGDRAAVLVDGGALQADAVCLAMKAEDMVPLLTEWDPELSRCLQEIRHESVLTACWAFRVTDFPSEIGAGGFLAPGEGEYYPFSSLKWFDAMPDGKYRCLRAFISESMSPEVFGESDAAVQDGILKIIREILGVRGFPVFGRVRRYPTALPVYEVGHAQKMARISKILQRYPGLFLTGNSFGGFGISECIHAARETARAILLPNGVSGISNT